MSKRELFWNVAVFTAGFFTRAAISFISDLTYRWRSERAWKIHLRKYERCPDCTGRGELDGRTCPYCHGDGSVERWRS